MYIFHHIFCCVVISGVVIKLLKIERIGMKKLATKFYVVRQGGVFFLYLMKFKVYELCFFRLNVNLTLVFIFILLLSYHVICVFLV